MKIAVSSTGMDMSAQIDQRFGRCACFLIVETDDMSFAAFENENAGLSSGVGVQSARFVADQGAQVVLTGRCGPKALQALSAAGLNLIEGQAGTVRDAVNRFAAGDQTAGAAATPPVGASGNFSRQNTGQAPGMGNMQGMGRCKGGMGGGRGGGMGSGGNQSSGMGMGRGRGKSQR